MPIVDEPEPNEITVDDDNEEELDQEPEPGPEPEPTPEREQKTEEIPAWAQELLNQQAALTEQVNSINRRMKQSKLPSQKGVSESDPIKSSPEPEPKPEPEKLSPRQAAQKRRARIIGRKR